jgi:hypothetical protein
MLLLAFYKGRPNSFINRIASTSIRWWTFSNYSHVELVDTIKVNPSSWIWYAAEPFANGVKKSSMEYKTTDWDLYSLNHKYQKRNAIEFFISQLNKSYDYQGLIFTQIFNIQKHDHKKWFCSEIVAEAIKRNGVELVKYSTWYSPKRLHNEMIIKKYMVKWNGFY